MLRWRRVVKRFGDNLAVEGLDLRADRGEILGLLGPNGAGKTTSVHMAVGLLAPDEGTVEIERGQNPLDADTRRWIGVAPQELALYDELTAVENLSFFGRVQGLRGREVRQRVEQVLDLVGLSDVASRIVGEFSGGMKRRLNLGAAIVHEPDLLLLDEPTVGVDPQSRHAIIDKVRSLRDAGCAIVYSTHYMDEAQRLCDRIAVIDRGRLRAVDSVEALLERHGGPGILVVTASGSETRIETHDPLETLEAVRRERSIESFRYEPPSLETVFLHLTGHALRD